MGKYFYLHQQEWGLDQEKMELLNPQEWRVAIKNRDSTIKNGNLTQYNHHK